jgi:haloalkane dehalogenase
MVCVDGLRGFPYCPKSVLRTLTLEEMEAYSSPYEAREVRLPTLQWPRELPIDGVPKDVVGIVEQYGAWFAECDHPKLFISAEPGAILVGRAREFCRTWRNQQEVTVKGIHFIQEDSPDEIGVALRDFVGGITKRRLRH